MSSVTVNHDNNKQRTMVRGVLYSKKKNIKTFEGKDFFFQHLKIRQ